jgi:hypothetical protein
VTGELLIDADAFEGFQGASVDLAATMVFTDPYSVMGSDATVTDDFEVTLTNPCTAAVPDWGSLTIADQALTIQNHPSETV